MVLALLGGAILLVRANLRAGRADRRGAGRIALFLLGMWTAAWALGARHSFDVDEETGRFLTVLAFSLLNVGIAWLFYLALEPFVRRLSPDMLIGWTRLLSGQLRDPRVGRDLLIGVVTGVFFTLLASIDVSALTGGAARQPQTSNMQYFIGARYAIARMLAMLPNALQSAMLGTFMYVLLLAIVRRRWIAATLVLIFICGVILAEAGVDNVWFMLTLAAALGGITIFVFLRFGFLAIATALYVNQVLHIVPLTIDPTRPHGGIAIVAMLGVMAIGSYGFYISRAGDRLFRGLLPAA
jgi:serine/threonine-protein kinase